MQKCIVINFIKANRISTEFELNKKNIGKMNLAVILKAYIHQIHQSTDS